MTMGTQAIRVAENIPNGRMQEFVALAEVLKPDAEYPVYELAVDGMALIVHDENVRYIGESIPLGMGVIVRMWTEMSNRTDYTKEEIKDFCQEPFPDNIDQSEIQECSVKGNDPIPDAKKIEIGGKLKEHPLYSEFKQCADKKYDDSDKGLAELVDDTMLMILNDITADGMRLKLYIMYIFTYRTKQFAQEKTEIEVSHLRDLKQEYMEAINTFQP